MSKTTPSPIGFSATYSARSSRSGESRPLTASSRASQLSFFSQYSLDELARRVFFRAPTNEEDSDGTVTPKARVTSISQTLASTPRNNNFPFDLFSKPLPPIRRTNSDLDHIELLAKSPLLDHREDEGTATTTTPTTPVYRPLPLPPASPPPKRRSMIDYSRAPRRPTKMKRHSTHLLSWSPARNPSVPPKPPKPHQPTLVPKTPSTPLSSTRVRPISLPPPTIRNPPTPFSWRNIRTSFQSENKRRFRSSLSVLPSYSESLNKNPDKSMQAPSDRPLPQIPVDNYPEWISSFVLVGILIPWFYILQTWTMKYPPLVETSEPPDMDCERTAGDVSTTTNQSLKSISMTPTQSYSRQPSDGSELEQGCQIPRRRRNGVAGCQQMTMAFFAALGTFLLSLWSNVNCF